ANPAENIKHLDAMKNQHPGADLYVHTEKLTTGFATEPEGIAEPEGSETLQWMKRKAQACDAAIAGSVAIEKEGKYYNRFYFVKPDGTVTYYNKRHLFTYGGEDKHFTRGQERVIVEFRGVRFLLLVCYDLRFPVWSRNRGDYDAMLYVANWPTPRVEAWKALLRARAIENQCYVAGVNRVGTDPSCEYCGGSAIISPYGQTLAACEDSQECVAEAELDMQALEAFRQKFPVLNDGEEFEILKD
ncbi:MAG: amidohydrolase, partial [Bacteroidaceae bacterium]|nr:amidohydrolase [Bacteroidaceae bacterium]